MAVSNPRPSEDPVTMINFPVKSFLIGFKGPLAIFLIIYNIIDIIINDNKNDNRVIFILYIFS